MRARILSVGTKMPAWMAEGVKQYVRRLPREFSCELVEVPAAKRLRNASPSNVRKHTVIESDKLQAMLKPGDWVVALDQAGQALDSLELARRMAQWQEQGRDVAFLIGGADGLSEACVARADECLSLSAMTFPHYLVRVILVEALYRAWSIVRGHPYHRE